MLVAIVKEILFFSSALGLLIAANVAQLTIGGGLRVFNLSAAIFFVVTAVLGLVWWRDKKRSRICRVFQLVGLCVGLLGSLTVWDGIDSKVWVVDGKIGKERKTPFAIPYVQNIRSMGKDVYILQSIVAVTKDDEIIQGTVALSLVLTSDDEKIRSVLEKFPNADAQIRDELKGLIRKRFEKIIREYRLAEIENDLVFEVEIGEKIMEEAVIARNLEWIWIVHISGLRMSFMSDPAKIL